MTSWTATDSSQEKDQSLSTTEALSLQRTDNQNGYILDVEQLGVDATNLKKTNDGHTVLIPQPSNNSDDPLNWSKRKKNTILAVISAIAFLPDFGSSLGAVTLLPQAEYILNTRKPLSFVP